MLSSQKDYKVLFCGFLMIKAIIFDLGGVCFEIDWVRINDEMFKKFNITTLIKSGGNDKVLSYYKEALEGKRPAEDMFQELNKDNKNLGEIVKFYKEMYKKHKKHSKEIYDLIKKLKDKFVLVCLSDTNAVHLEAHQEQGTIRDFHRVFTSFQIGSIKRDANTFKKVIESLSVRPEEVIFIDDNEKNIAVAKSLGINVIRYVSYEGLVSDLKAYGISP